MANTVTSLSAHTAPHNSSIPEDCTEVRLSHMDYLPWDNPDNMVSAEVEKLTSELKDVLTFILFLISGPANAINMAVFFKQGLQDRVNLCLFSLSLCDCLYLAAGLCLHGENAILILASRENTTPLKVLTNHNFVTFMGLIFVSECLSAIIALERCVCVFRPLKYQTLMRTRTMAAIIVVVFVVVLALFFIVAFKFRVGCVYDPDSGLTMQTMVAGSFYIQHQDLIDFLDSVVFGAFFPGGTIIVVFTATFLTAVKLRHIMTWRATTSATMTSSLSSPEVALTKMLIGSSVVFIVCIFPNCVFPVVALFLPEMKAGGRHHNFYFSTLWVLTTFTFVNSTFNLLVYYVMGSKFRDTFWALLSRRKDERNLEN